MSLTDVPGRCSASAAQPLAPHLFVASTCSPVANISTMCGISPAGQPLEGWLPCSTLSPARLASQPHITTGKTVPAWHSRNSHLIAARGRTSSRIVSIAGSAAANSANPSPAAISLSCTPTAPRPRTTYYLEHTQGATSRKCIGIVVHPEPTCSNQRMRTRCAVDLRQTLVMYRDVVRQNLHHSE